tara:strand:+ start:4583 stop:6427 length:1845 start_codon:yes stop_codon:yes gene_type:complete
MRNFKSIIHLSLAIFILTSCNEGDKEVTPEPAPLILISDEAAGENCEQGGVRIESGFDENDNEQLDEAEIKSIAYVCDGVSEDVLVVTSDEPAGENCEDGGIKLLIGLDENKNGELDTEEVAQISFICDGQPASTLGKSHLVLSGNITDAEAQARINSTVGPHTQFVTIKNTTQLKEVDLSSVETLVELQIIDNDSLKSVNLSQLQLVEDGVTIGDNSELVLDMSALTTIYGEMDLYSNSMTSFDLSALTSLNSLILRDHITQEVSFPALEKLGLLQIKENTVGVITCNFPELTSLDGLSVIDNLYVDSINVSIPKITYVRNVDYFNNQSSDFSSFSPGFEHLEEVDYFIISDNTCLPDQLEFTNLKRFSSMQFNYNNLPEVVSFPALTVAGGLFASFNANLASIYIPFLEEVETVYLNNNDELSTVEIPGLPQAGTINLTNNTLLNNIDLTSLTYVSDNFRIAGSDALTSLSLLELDSAYRIDFFDNTVLDVVTFQNLEKVTELDFRSNDQLTDIELPALKTISELLSVYENPLLTSLNLDLIETIGGSNIYLDLNAFDSNQVNYLLAKLVSLNPSINNVTIELAQSTPAPPTGQGLTDKSTLEGNNNTVNTD